MGLVAYGKSLAEAFANAACGLFSLIVEPNKDKLPTTLRSGF